MMAQGQEDATFGWIARKGFSGRDRSMAQTFKIQKRTCVF